MNTRKFEEQKATTSSNPASYANYVNNFESFQQRQTLFSSFNQDQTSQPGNKSFTTRKEVKGNVIELPSFNFRSNSESFSSSPIRRKIFESTVEAAQQATSQTSKTPKRLLFPAETRNYVEEFKESFAQRTALLQEDRSNSKFNAEESFANKNIIESPKFRELLKSNSTNMKPSSRIKLFESTYPEPVNTNLPTSAWERPSSPLTSAVDRKQSQQSSYFKNLPEESSVPSKLAKHQSQPLFEKKTNIDSYQTRNGTREHDSRLTDSRREQTDKETSKSKVSVEAAMSSDVILQLRSEINKKGLEIIELRGKQLKMANKFQQEKDKWEEQRQLKDNLLRQRQEELATKDKELTSLANQVSELKLRYQTAESEIQDVYIKENRDLKRKIESVENELKSKQEEQRKEESSKIKAIIEEYNSLIEKQKKSNEESKRGYEAIVMRLENELGQRDLFIEETKQKEQFLSENKEKYDQMKQYSERLSAELAKYRETTTAELDRKDREIGQIRQDYEQLRKILHRTEELQKKLEVDAKQKDVKIKELERMNNQMVEDEIQLREQFAQQLKLKEQEINETLSYIRRPTAAGGSEESFTQTQLEIGKINREICTALSELRSLNKLVRSHIDTKPGDLSLSIETSSLEQLKKRSALQNIDTLRRELDSLKGNLMDHYADSIGNECVTQ